MFSNLSSIAIPNLILNKHNKQIKVLCQISEAFPSKTHKAVHLVSLSNNSSSNSQQLSNHKSKTCLAPYKWTTNSLVLTLLRQLWVNKMPSTTWISQTTKLNKHRNFSNKPNNNSQLNSSSNKHGSQRTKTMCGVREATYST